MICTEIWLQWLIKPSKKIVSVVLLNFWENPIFCIIIIPKIATGGPRIVLILGQTENTVLFENPNYLRTILVLNMKLGMNFQQYYSQCLKTQKEDKKIAVGWNVDFLYYYDVF